MPLLSICIPTYNRGKLLDTLLADLATYDVDSTLSQIEVCISDNASTDETDAVIQYWESRLPIISQRQVSNTGASANLLFVSKMASTDWIYLIGDDDRLIKQGLSCIVELLKTAPQTAWILPEIIHPIEPPYFVSIPDGPCHTEVLKRHILTYGVGHLGFIGSHVISRRFFKILWKEGIQIHFGWPHLSLMFRCLHNASFTIIRQPLAKQSVEGMDYLSWTGPEWLLMHAIRTKLCINALENNRLFKLRLLIRDYRSYLSVILASRLIDTPSHQITEAIIPHIDTLNLNRAIIWGLKLGIYIMSCIPGNWVRKLYQCLNKPSPTMCAAKFDATTNGVSRKL